MYRVGVSELPLVFREDDVTVFDNELNSEVLGVHVCHLTLNSSVPHDGRRENHSKVLGRHLHHVSTRRPVAPQWP